MKFEKREEIVEAEDLLNLTSMIDVVFTLLAFFVISMRVFGAERDAVVGAERPLSPAGIVQGDLPQRITIRLIDVSGTGKMQILVGSQELASPAEITQQLQAINLPSVPVVFAASPTLTVEQVAAAVDAALHSPMQKVSLQRLGGDGSP
jgi:biopolymer transport protein ExbD